MALKQMETTIVKIGENTFYLKPFKAFEAVNLSGELTSVISPLVGAFAPLVGNGNILDTEISADKVVDVFSGVDIDGNKLERLMKKLLLGGNVVIEYEDENGETQQDTLDQDLANEVFCGNVQDMFVLCSHVIKLNFNGFFKRLATLSGKAEQVVAKTPRKRL